MCVRLPRWRDLESEDRERVSSRLRSSKGRGCLFQEASKLNSYPSSLKRVNIELILCPEERVKEGPGELLSHYWVKTPRWSKVLVYQLLNKGDPAEPFLNSLSTERERGFPALLVKPSLC